MGDFPVLKDMTELDLIMLHHKVADSIDPTDMDFKRSIELELKERCVTITENI